jgi:BlaI family penicillinase repressor
MADKKELPDISKAEYDILRILWKSGAQSVRELHEKIQASNQWAYTTTKTMMDRMAQKGLLARQQFHGIFLYQAQISRPAGLAKFIQFFADRVLETDAMQVVNMFAASNSLSPEEIEELEKLLYPGKKSNSGK